MDDSIQELRQELFSAVVRMRRASTHLPVPVGVTPAEGAGNDRDSAFGTAGRKRSLRRSGQMQPLNAKRHVAGAEIP